MRPQQLVLLHRRLTARAAKAVFDDEGRGGLRGGRCDEGWKGAQKYVARCRRCSTFGRTRRSATTSEEIKKLMKTYVQYPPRKLQSAS